MDDIRRIVLPEPIASDKKAFEVASAWVHGGKVLVMTGTGTGLDGNADFWGVALAAVASNVALSAEKTLGINRQAMLDAMKKSLDAQWSKLPFG